jgi:hypothetical protein
MLAQFNLVSLNNGGPGRILGERNAKPGKRTVANLADVDERRGRDDLRLAVAQRHDHGGGNHLGADHSLACVTTVTVPSARQHDDVDGRALLGRPAVVQVVEGARRALPEDGRVAQGERAVGAGREARRDERAGLRGVVELELVVGRDVARAGVVVGQDAVGQLDN